MSPTPCYTNTCKTLRLKFSNFLPHKELTQKRVFLRIKSVVEFGQIAKVQDFTQAVAIVISGVLASSMVDALMLVSPRTQASINAVFIRVYKGTWDNSVGDQRLNGLLLHIGKHVDDHLTTPLNHPKDRWPLFLQGATTTF